jgi:hypothetical protein
MLWVQEKKEKPSDLRTLYQDDDLFLSLPRRGNLATIDPCMEPNIPLDANWDLAGGMW